MEFLRIPARRNPRQTSVTTEKNDSAPPESMTSPKMVEYHLGSSDISQS